MDTTDYIWLNGEFVPWNEAKIHVVTHGLHYGSSVFEGIRCYETARGAAIFRLKDHIDRLYYSAGALKMPVPWSKADFTAATVELIRRNCMPQGYIRPIFYYGYGKMGLNPKGAPVEGSISCWPWGAYLPHEAVDVKISSYIRIHPRSTVTDAKISGHYVNSILAVQEIEGTEFHEAMFLDASGHVAEGPGENIFLIKGGVLYTPKLGSILAGITRNTITQIAAAKKIQVIETEITPEMAYNADEAFFTGTAAEVCPIRSIDGHTLGNGSVGSLTRELKEAYLAIVYGRDPNFANLLTYVI